MTGTVVPSDRLSDDDILNVLRTDPWPRRTNSEVAAFLGVPPKRVLSIREKNGIDPTFVERMIDGELTIVWVPPVSSTGRKTKKKKPLTKAQQDLFMEVWKRAEDVARYEAKDGLLSGDDLVDVATEALNIAVRSWKPGGLPWRYYAINGVRRMIARAFSVARNREQHQRRVVDVGVIIGAYTTELRAPADCCRSDLADDGLYGANEFRQSAESFVEDKTDEPTLVEKVYDLRGLPRLVMMFVAGLVPPGPRKVGWIAKFFGVSEPVVQAIIERAKFEMID